MMILQDPLAPSIAAAFVRGGGGGGGGGGGASVQRGDSRTDPPPPRLPTAPAAAEAAATTAVALEKEREKGLSKKKQYLSTTGLPRCTVAWQRENIFKRVRFASFLRQHMEGFYYYVCFRGE